MGSKEPEGSPSGQASGSSAVPVALVIGQLELGGGAERQLAEIAMRLPEHGFRPLVVSLRAGQRAGSGDPENYWADYLRARGVFVLEIPRGGNWDLRRIVPLVAFLRAHSPRIVHSFLFPANAYARAGALLARGKFVLVKSERSGRLPEGFLESLVDRILNTATHAIMTNSASEGRKIRAQGTKLPIWVIPNGIDTVLYTPEGRSRARQRLDCPPETPLVGIVARMAHQKNYPFFIRLIQQVRKAAPGVRAIAVGDGPLRPSIEQEIARAGLADVVRLVGKVGNVHEILPALDVLVLVSRYEGLPNAVLEAQACGVPAVVTDVGGSAEIVIDGETGYVVPPGEPDLFAQRVATLLTDPGARQRMGQAGRRRAESSFSIRSMVSATVSMYRALLEGGAVADSSRFGGIA